MKITIEHDGQSVSISNDEIDEESTWVSIMRDLVMPMFDGMGYELLMEKLSEAALNDFEEIA